ncbi:MAG: serine/threonine-protein kinase [Amnibacterium sp.]
MGSERGTDEPVPGDVLGGRYEILGEIGRGGMATVYKGRDLRLSRKVAVKVFRGGFADAVDPRRTTQEMQLLAGVNHPAIVSVLDASNGDGRFGTYLVMELVAGDDLGALLRRARGPLSADFARRIVADVASALELLHGQGVVHRDVKPGNILVGADAARSGHSGVTAKLTDFGIARMVDGAALTAPDSILGTAAYLSPEQVRGARLRPASDVYSLGLVLLEALTGHRAFPGPAAEAAVARLTRPPALPADASPALAHLLSRMTALDPADRPRAADVAAALREDLAGAITAPDAAHTAPVPRQDLPHVVAAAAPVVAAAGTAGAAGASAGAEESTLPHPNLWTPAAGIPIGTGNVPVQTGPRPVVDPAERRRRFPTLLAVGASALAAAAAGVLVSTMSGVWNAPQAAVGDVRDATGATAGVVTSAPPSSGPAASSVPLKAATGGEAVATTPRARATPSRTASHSPSPTPTATSTPSSTPSTSTTTTPAPTGSATTPPVTPTPDPSTSGTGSSAPSPSASSTGGTGSTGGDQSPGTSSDSLLAAALQ